MADYSAMSWSELERMMYGTGASFDRIAFERLGNGNGTAKKLRQAFTTSLKKGETYEQLLHRIEKVTGAEAYAARRIARTEMTRIESTAKMTAALEYLKQSGGTLKKKWICTFHNSRDSHIGLHGDIVGINDDFIADGGPMKYPGDGSRVGPEEIINCQCYLEILKG